MVVPLIIAGAGATLSAVYNVGKAYDNYRFWSDYSRRYHVRSKYPFRSGRFDHLNYAGKALATPSFTYKYFKGYRPSRFNNDYGMYR